jgi:integrase
VRATELGPGRGGSDTRFRALVLLAAFVSLRWGEVTALRRCDLDMAAGTVRVRATFTERSNGQIILGPPKSRAGLRTVSIPTTILPDIAAHLAKHTRPDANERAALIYQHKSSPADRQIADGLDALLRTSRDRRSDDDGTTGTLAR